jgi:hypothetical protein
MRDIKTLIDVMITFNLSYIQQRAANGENVLELEPYVEFQILKFIFFLFIKFRPIDTVAYFPGIHEKRGLSFGTRQMIFKELLKERVKRNIRLKSDKQEMPVSINRQIDPTPKPYVTFF